MIANSTVEIMSFSDLAEGNIFYANNANGEPFIGMKVATRSDPSDVPTKEILQLSQDRPPSVISPSFLLSSRVVAKLTNLEFHVSPKKEEILFDLRQDSRARKAIGCLFLVGSDLFLAADAGHVNYYVNVRTGEGWDARPGTHAVAIPTWQIVEVVGDHRVPWLHYEVPTELVSSRVA